jgi:hypothetical protein
MSLRLWPEASFVDSSSVLRPSDLAAAPSHGGEPWLLCVVEADGGGPGGPDITRSATELASLSLALGCLLLKSFEMADLSVSVETPFSFAMSVRLSPLLSLASSWSLVMPSALAAASRKGGLPWPPCAGSKLEASVLAVLLVDSVLAKLVDFVLVTPLVVALLAWRQRERVSVCVLRSVLLMASSLGRPGKNQWPHKRSVCRGRACVAVLHLSFIKTIDVSG